MEILLELRKYFSEKFKDFLFKRADRCSFVVKAVRATSDIKYSVILINIKKLLPTREISLEFLEKGEIVFIVEGNYDILRRMSNEELKKYIISYGNNSI